MALDPSNIPMDYDEMDHSIDSDAELIRRTGIIQRKVNISDIDERLSNIEEKLDLLLNFIYDTKHLKEAIKK